MQAATCCLHNHMEFVVPAVPPTELASPAASAVPASPSSPPSPPRRRGTKLGLLLHRTETLDHPCVPLFYFTLKGDPDLGELRTRVNAALGRFETAEGVEEGLATSGTFPKFWEPARTCGEFGEFGDSPARRACLLP